MPHFNLSLKFKQSFKFDIYFVNQAVKAHRPYTQI